MDSVEREELDLETVGRFRYWMAPSLVSGAGPVFDLEPMERRAKSFTIASVGQVPSTGNDFLLSWPK
jgi:hypothetical protein